MEHICSVQGNLSEETAMAVSGLELSQLPLQLDGAGDEETTETSDFNPEQQVDLLFRFMFFCLQNNLWNL